MSFKDKLKTIKKGQATPEKSQNFSSEDKKSSSSFPGLDDLDTPDIKAEPIKGKQSKGKKPQSKSSISTLKRNIVVLALLLVFLLGLLAYFFMQSNQSVESNPIPVNKEVQKPSDSNVEAPTPTGKMTDNVSTDEASTVITPPSPVDVNPVPEIQKLEETIDMDIPANTVQAAEEIDMFKDEMQRLDEQEKALTNQISDQEKIVALKEQRIKLLEKQLESAE